MKRTLFGVLSLVVLWNTAGVVGFAQEAAEAAEAAEAPKEPIFPDKNLEAVVRKSVYAKPVSYTHLTLPTIYSV